MEFVETISHNFLAFIIIISILVFIHEFGHYWVALKNGVKIETFSIGFGKELFGWTDKRGTHWRIALIPLGGYVKMFGDVDPTSATADPAVAALAPEQRRHAFYSKTVGQRAAIVAAGPGINFLFCIIALFFLFITYGKPHTPPIIDGLADNMPAQAIGMQVGDRIVSINGLPIDDFSDVREQMAKGLDSQVTILVDRAGKPVTFEIKPALVEEDSPAGKHRIGRLGIIGGKPDYVRLMPMQAVVESFTETYKMVVNTFVGLGQIINGDRSSKELGGAITIAKMSGDMSQSIPSLIWFMAMLSANLGLINLFPIPVLDGGHLAFYAAEAVRRRPLSERAQEYSLRFGLALVLTLTVFALWNDLSNFGVVSYIAGLFS